MIIPANVQALLGHERGLARHDQRYTLLPLRRLELYDAFGPTFQTASLKDRFQMLRAGQYPLTAADRVRARLARLTAAEPDGAASSDPTMPSAIRSSPRDSMWGSTSDSISSPKGYLMELTLSQATAQLKSKQSVLRAQAALALGMLGDPAAIPALLVAIHERNEVVRNNASLALGMLGAPALPHLLKLLRGRDERAGAYPICAGPDE